MFEDTVRLKDPEEARSLLGPLDTHARLVKDVLRVSLVPQGSSLKLLGPNEAVLQARTLLLRVLHSIRSGGRVETDQFRGWLLELVSGGRKKGKVQPRTRGQASYLEALRSSRMVFVVGPAGTGKTYLAVAHGCECLAAGEFSKLVLTRPAVEAGEKLGFLPGDYQAKVNPYLRPLYDALHDLLDPVMIKRYMENDVIEVCPLAFMRGRTLNDAFIILDEGQNTTPAQMLMFLTRMGEQSKLVVTGDITQTDLPQGVVSGLLDAERKLGSVEGIIFEHLTQGDIVRHPLVEKVVRAYSEAEPDN